MASLPRVGALHLRVALASGRLPLFGTPAQLRPVVDERLVAGSGPDANPDDRIVFLKTVVVGWLSFALVSGLAMVGLAYVCDLIAGFGGRRFGVALGAGALFFCVGGAFIGIWRECFAYLARRRARMDGEDSAGYRRAARRATMHDSSVIIQALVAAVAMIAVLAS